MPFILAFLEEDIIWILIKKVYLCDYGKFRYINNFIYFAAYLQEIGRAGHDGRQAVATLYYNATDISKAASTMTDAMRESSIGLMNADVNLFVQSSHGNLLQVRILCLTFAVTYVKATVHVKHVLLRGTHQKHPMMWTSGLQKFS